MFLRHASQALYAKLETVYGTLSAPSLAADVMRVFDLNVKPLNASISRDQVVSSAWGNNQAFHDGITVTVDFKMYLTGAGTAGDEPAWGLFAKVAGNAVTIEAGVDATYNHISADGSSATVYVSMDSNRHPITGLRGNIKFQYDAKKRPFIQFNGIGLFGAPVAHVNITPDISDIVQPLPVGNTYTTCTLHGVTVNMVSFMYDQGNKVAHVDVTGYEGIDIDDREPTGELIIMAPSVVTKDWFTAAKDGDVGALIVEHGDTAGDGNFIRSELQAVQLLTPEYTDVDGKAAIKFGLNPLPGLDTAGNDECLIIVS